MFSYEILHLLCVFLFIFMIVITYPNYIQFILNSFLIIWKKDSDPQKIKTCWFGYWKKKNSWHQYILEEDISFWLFTQQNKKKQFVGSLKNTYLLQDFNTGPL